MSLANKKHIENDEKNGPDPILIAKLIESLIHKKKLKVRYIVGKPTQTMAITLKRLLGETLFEKVMRIIWKVK